jgi:beta-lactamase class A
MATLPSPLALPPPPDPAFGALRADLAVMPVAWPGAHAVLVLDIDTGRMISINGERPQLVACTIKISILVAVWTAGLCRCLSG